MNNKTIAISPQGDIESPASIFEIRGTNEKTQIERMLKIWFFNMRDLDVEIHVISKGICLKGPLLRAFTYENELVLDFKWLAKTTLYENSWERAEKTQYKIGLQFLKEMKINCGLLEFFAPTFNERITFIPHAFINKLDETEVKGLIESP